MCTCMYVSCRRRARVWCMGVQYTAYEYIMAWVPRADKRERVSAWSPALAKALVRALAEQVGHVERPRLH